MNTIIYIIYGITFVWVIYESFIQKNIPIWLRFATIISYLVLLVSFIRKLHTLMIVSLLTFIIGELIIYIYYIYINKNDVSYDKINKYINKANSNRGLKEKDTEKKVGRARKNKKGKEQTYTGRRRRS